MAQTARDLYDGAPELLQGMIAGDFPDANILHLQHDGTGTVYCVFESAQPAGAHDDPPTGGLYRHYWAQEFTVDGEGDDAYLGAGMGYHTTDKFHYMGERFNVRGAWGPYAPEVHFHPQGYPGHYPSEDDVPGDYPDFHNVWYPVMIGTPGAMAHRWVRLNLNNCLEFADSERMPIH